MFKFLDKLFDVSSSNNIYDIPEKLHDELKENLQPSEEIINTLRLFKSNYKAERIIDRNSFFNAFMILTNQRIIVARNSKSLQKFRDIPLNIIQHHTFEVSSDRPILTIHMLNSRDILEFPKKSKAQVDPAIESLKHLLSKTNEEPKDKIYCRFCGYSIPSDSSFCENCGKKLS